MYPSSKNDKEENSITSQGGGDGVTKSHAVNTPSNASKKRTAIPSARKFNAKVIPDESLKLKLEDAIKSETKKSSAIPKGCVRSASVAEITPSKSVAKKKKRHTTAGAGDAPATSASSTATLYTPRPLEGMEPIPRKCPVEKVSCEVYKRLMLLAWRRTKNRHSELILLMNERDEQLAQLERQNGVLNDLRQSEEQKRTEALIENQKMRKILEALDFTNTNLTTENKDLKKCVQNFESSLIVATENISILNDKAKRMQEQLKKKTEEKRTLEDKVVIQEKELYSQKVIISHLQDTMKNSDRNLKETESNLRFKNKKYAQLKQEHKKQLEEVDFLASKIKEMSKEKEQLNNQNKYLEGKLQELENSSKNLQENIELLKFDVKEMTLELEEEKKKTWTKNTKDLALLTINALHHMALIMLPAYRQF